LGHFLHGKRIKEPNVAEFILALTGVNKTKKQIIMACATSAGSTTLALVAVVNQTGGG